jgi:nitroreductase
MAMVASVEHAADHFADYPLLMFAFQRGDTSGGSIYPAVWSAMLAARAEGIGTSLTTVLSFAGDRVPDLLGVPRDRGWSMVACVPMGYPTGRWGLAQRRPAHEVTYRNGWGTPAGFTVERPLWPDPA